MTSTSPAGSIHHAAPLTEGSHQFMTRIINGINGHARSHTLITFPIKVPKAGFRPLVNGLRKRNSAITIGKSISTTSIDCFQAVGEVRAVSSDGNHPAKDEGRRR